jgi:hypothetical protein
MDEKRNKILNILIVYFRFPDPGQDLFITWKKMHRLRCQKTN